MKPNYIAKTSIWRNLRLWKLILWLLMWGAIVPLYLFGWDLLADMGLQVAFFAIAGVLLFIPIIWLLIMRLIVKNRYIEFYKDKIVQHWGVLNKQEHSAIFIGTTATNLKRTFRGRIFNYGHVQIDCAGKWDFEARFVKNPYRLIRYLNNKAIKATKAGKFVEI